MEQILENLKTSAKQLYAKLKDLYLSMTFGNRVVATLLMATLLISLGYLIVGSIQKTDFGSKTVFMYNGHRFTYDEQRAAQNALSKENLRDFQWVGDQLQVPTDKQHIYHTALANANVIGTTNMARKAAADALGVWDSSKIMNERMVTAKEIDCARSIKLIPGIAEAIVLTNKRPHWERNVWARTHITSVGVFVEAVENRPLSADTIGAIGRIVKPIFGITDLREISIVDLRHHRAYDGSGEEQSSSQSEYQRHQTRYQEQWNERLYRHMANIDGLKIETSIMLTTYRTRQLFDVTHRRPTPLVTHELDFHFHREGYDRFFRPGQIAQWGSPLINPTGEVSPRDVTDEKKREQEITHALPGTEMNEEALPYIPQEIRASIQVPREHILAIWRQKNKLFGDPNAKPTPEQLREEEEEFIRTTKEDIAKLLEPYRLSAKSDPLDLVRVSFYDPIRPDEVELTAWEKFVLFMQQNWQSIGLMSLVFSGLVVLWAISKPPKPEPIVIYEGLETPEEAIDARLAEKLRREEEARRLAEEEALAEAEQEEFENSLGELGSLRSLRDEIAELIAKNPEAATAVIRQWIGNAVLVEAKS